MKGQERGYLQEALRALDLPLGKDDEPQLQKNYTGVLITKLLQAVNCEGQIGTSQDICNKVKPTPVLMLSVTLQPFAKYLLFVSSHSCLLIPRNVLVMAGMRMNVEA